ncbi:MAG: hypothetical protein GTO03_06390 [Planctomycetales bacterium]|nr:hypothetical protein [Planctomycetales bacterium]
MFWIHPRKPWLKLRRKTAAAVAVMQMGVRDHTQIAAMVGLSPAEIARIDAAEDKAVRELVLEGIPAGEFFALVQQIRCPKCGGLLTLAPCVTCGLDGDRRLSTRGPRMTPRHLPSRYGSPRILLATADVELRSSIHQLLRYSGYDVSVCRSASALMDRFGQRATAGGIDRFELLICDARLLDFPAVAALQQLRRRRQPPLVLLSPDDRRSIPDMSDRLRASQVCGRFDLMGQLAMVRRLVPLHTAAGRGLRAPP